MEATDDYFWSKRDTHNVPPTFMPQNSGGATSVLYIALFSECVAFKPWALDKNGRFAQNVTFQ